MTPEEKALLEAVLDSLTRHTYDSGHGLLYPTPNWVVSTEGVIDDIVEHLGMTTDEMRNMFDEARVRVHGSDVDLS